MDNKEAILMPWNGPAEFPPRLRTIRHLKRINIARLRVGEEQHLYSSFFTLHDDVADQSLCKPFYTSEVAEETTFPQWNALPEGLLDPQSTYYNSQKSFVICIWESKFNLPRRLLHKIRVDLTELAFISTTTLDFPENTLLIELHDGVYTTYQVRNELEMRGVIQRRDHYSDEDNSKRVSCSRSVLVDILSKRREYLLKLSRATELRNLIAEKMHENSEYFDKLALRNQLESELVALKIRYESLNTIYQRKKQDLEARQALLIPSAKKLNEAQMALAVSIEELKLRKQDLTKQHLELKKIFFLIRKHQEHLLTELSYIYNIQVEKGKSKTTSTSSQSNTSNLLYTINGIELNRQSFADKDEEEIACGLGYVCHLIKLLSVYLDVPLRYPIKPMMSRSTIQDVVNNSVSYPLYSKFQDIGQFEKGVVLLNRNIEQLVLSQGLVPGPLRETLPNLKKLYDAFIPSQTPQTSTSTQQSSVAQNSNEPSTEIKSEPTTS